MPVYQHYQAYQPSHAPARSDSTASLPASNEIYILGGGGGRNQQPTMQYSNSLAVTKYGEQARAPTNNSSSNSTSLSTRTGLSRAGSTASLPLAVALGSDPSHIAAASSSLSPSSSASNGGSSSTALTTTSNGGSRGPKSLAIESASSSGSSLSIPSLLSPSQRIQVPLIKWSEVAPPDANPAAKQTSEMKSEFHQNLRAFLKTAKENIEDLTAELFYEEDDDSDDDDDHPESGAVDSSKRDSSRSLVPSLHSASSKQLGSPRKTALLQSLMSLSANMDSGLAQIQAAKDAAAKKAKSAGGAGGGGGGWEREGKTAAVAPRFNKTDIAQLAAMAREEKAPASASPSTSVALATGKYPSTISSSSQAALTAFVRRSQLTERHRAYDQWVEQKERDQQRARDRADKEEKVRRLREMQERKHAAALSAQEAEKARLEEAQLMRELAEQSARDEKERREREQQETLERARLEAERLEREEARRRERESDAARAKLEAEMLRREEEEARWRQEKREKEQAEDEAQRVTEELKAQVAKDLQMMLAGQSVEAHHQTPAEEQAEEAHQRREQAELDALFLEATRGEEAGGTHQQLQEEAEDAEDADAAGAAAAEVDQDTDEEFGEFESPRSNAAAAGRRAAAAASRPPKPATTAGGALAGRKGRAQASLTGGYQMPAGFPQAPALPSSVARTAGSSSSVKPMSFGGGGQPTATTSTNHRFERAKRMHGR